MPGDERALLIDRIGLVKPNTSMAALSWASWLFACVRALRGSGFRLTVARYATDNGLDV
jgi:hypothetical protein